MIETRTAAKTLPRYWGISRTDRLAHRFRAGGIVALCEVRRTPGTKLTDDPSLTARPCGACTEIAHQELDR